MLEGDPDIPLRQRAEAVTGRRGSFLTQDVQSLEDRLRGKLEDSHVCITGGGGFIARQLLFRLFDYRPARVMLLDVSENSLASTMRDVEAHSGGSTLVHVEPLLVDLASPGGTRALTRLENVDTVFHLAAVKHVRSEMDELSLSRMFEVNVGTALTVGTYAASTSATVVAVSTDKAAQPQTLMGASKAMMESVLLAGSNTTAARFPNVAFSTGSLLDSWRRRIELGEAIPVPRDTRRFLINPSEAADMCVAALAAHQGSIVIPRTGVLPNLELESVARSFLDHVELPEHPVGLTGRIVASEKADECFVSVTEVEQPWLNQLSVIRNSHDSDAIMGFWEWWLDRSDGEVVLCPELISRVAAAIPEYRAPVLVR